MYVCMVVFFVCACVSVFVWVCVCMYECMYVCMHTHKHGKAVERTFLDLNICICLAAHMHVCVNMSTHTHTHTHTHAHTSRVKLSSQIFLATLQVWKMKCAEATCIYLRGCLGWASLLKSCLGWSTAYLQLRHHMALMGMLLCCCLCTYNRQYMHA
jgi:hypothetical protein